MAQIPKLKKGKTVEKQTTYESDLELINNYRKNPNANPEIIKQLDAIVTEGRNVSLSDNLTAIGQNRLNENLVHRMASIVKGESLYNPNETRIGYQGIFSGTKGNVDLIANQIEANAQAQTVNANNSNTTVNVPLQEAKHFTYNPFNGLNASLLTNDATVKDRVKLIANTVINNLNQFANTKGQQYYLHGVQNTDREGLNIVKNNLQDLIKNIDSRSDEDAFKELTNIVQNAKFNEDNAKLYKNIFKEFYTTASDLASQYNNATTKNARLATLQQAGYTDSALSQNPEVLKYISELGGNLLDYDGNTYAYADYDLNQPITDRGRIFTDFTNDNYMKALVIDANGKVHFDDWNNFTADRIGSDLYQRLAQQTSNANKDRYYVYNWNQYSENPIIQQAIAKVASDTSIDPNMKRVLTETFKNGRLADLSQYFSGNNIVLGVLNPNESENSVTGVDWRDHLMITYNPATKEISYGTFDPSTYNHKGYNESGQQFFDTTNGVWNADFLNDYSTLIDSDYLDSLYNQPIQKGAPWLQTLFGRGKVYADKQTMSNYAIDKWISPNEYDQAFFNSAFPTEDDRLGFLRTIYQMYRNGNITLTPYRIKRLHDIIEMERQKLNDRKQNINIEQTAGFKDGGILKAKEGQTAQYNVSNEFKRELQQNQITKEKAQAKNKSVSQYQNSESLELTTADWIRLGTTAADLTTIGTSFIPVVGNAVSGITAALTTVIDLGVDMFDPSLSAGDVMKNLGINAALTGAAILPGGGALKTLKGAVKLGAKLTPLIMSGAMMLNPEVQDSWIKWTTSGTENLTRNDVMNIAYAFKAISGSVSASKSAFNNRKLYIDKHKTNKFNLKTESGKQVQLSENDIQKIRTAGKSGGQTEAQKVFQNIVENTPELKGEKLAGLEVYGDVKSPRNKLQQLKFKAKQDPFKASKAIESTNEEDLIKYFSGENRYRKGSPASPSDEQIASWLQWLPTNAEMANRKLFHLPKPLQSVTPNSKVTTPIRTTTTKTNPTQPLRTDLVQEPYLERNGGKLEKLINYVNSK